MYGGGGSSHLGYYDKGWGLGSKGKDGPFNYNNFAGGNGLSTYGGGQGNGYSYGGSSGNGYPSHQGHPSHPAPPGHPSHSGPSGHPSHSAHQGQPVQNYYGYPSAPSGPTAGDRNGVGQQWTRRPGVDGKSLSL